MKVDHRLLLIVSDWMTHAWIHCIWRCHMLTPHRPVNGYAWNFEGVYPWILHRQLFDFRFRAQTGSERFLPTGSLNHRNWKSQSILLESSWFFVMRVLSSFFYFKILVSTKEKVNGAEAEVGLYIVGWHIRVWSLVSGWDTLEYYTWSRVPTH